MQNPASNAPVPLGPNEKITGTLVFLAVSLSTWGFAGRASWAPAAFTTLALLAAFFSVALSRREGVGFRFRAFLPALLLGLIVAVSLLNLSYSQLSGAPGVWVPRKTWWPWLPGTVDRATTLGAMLPWLAALLLGAALRQAALGRRAMRLLWGGLLGHGLLVAAVGAFFYFTNSGMILGLYHDRHGYHFASFIYRNHWAAYVFLLVSLALGFSFSALRRWSAGRGRLDAILPGLIAALLLALTLPMPGSRSGVVVVLMLLLGALARLVWVLWSARRGHRLDRTHWLGLTGLAILLGLTLAIGGLLNRDAFQRQWSRTLPQLRNVTDWQGNLRVKFSQDTLRMASARPVWGWGLGSFGLIFPQYQGDYLRDARGEVTARLLHAHNDWAEVWAETGLVGLAILLTPVLVLLRNTWRRREVLSRWGAGGVMLVLGYALVDFPLHSPAVLFLWVVILSSAAPSASDPT